MYVPGADWLDAKDVPHGAISVMTYWSAKLNRFRRLYVYTPSGYEAGKAKPMVVIMPHGHTGPFSFGMPISGEFEPEFVTDIIPQMEKCYRVCTDRRHRAMAVFPWGDRTL